MVDGYLKAEGIVVSWARVVASLPGTLGKLTSVRQEGKLCLTLPSSHNTVTRHRTILPMEFLTFAGAAHTNESLTTTKLSGSLISEEGAGCAPPLRPREGDVTRNHSRKDEASSWVWGLHGPTVQGKNAPP